MGKKDAPPPGMRWHENPNGEKIAVPVDAAISEGVVIGADTMLESNVTIEAHAYIGSRSRIGSNVLIRRSVIVPPGTRIPHDHWVNKNGSGDMTLTRML